MAMIEKMIKKLELKWLLIMIFSFINSILAGYIQVTIYLFVVVFAYFLFRLNGAENQKNKLKKIIWFCGAGVIRLFLFDVIVSPARNYFCLFWQRFGLLSNGDKKNMSNLISRRGNGHTVNRSWGFCIQLPMESCFLTRFGDEISCIVPSLRIHNQFF